jgi:hypothetical protein
MTQIPFIDHDGTPQADIDLARRCKENKRLIELRRIAVADRYLKGMSIKQIAADLSINDRLICSEIEAIRSEWKAARVGFVDQAVLEQLEKIDQLEREAWAAYERSCRPAKSTTITEDDDGNTVTKIERRESAGDPRFLALVDKQVEQRRKILGLDAPVKTESNINATVTHYQPPKTREELAAEVQKMRDRVREQLQTQSPN